MNCIGLINEKKDNMRKVMFKKWIPAEYENGKRIEGTNCFEKEYSNAGLFHQWGMAYEEFTDTVGNYTVGIIELHNGEIVEVLPSNIKFLGYPKYKN